MCLRARKVFDLKLRSHSCATLAIARIEFRKYTDTLSGVGKVLIVRWIKYDAIIAPVCNVIVNKESVTCLLIINSVLPAGSANTITFGIGARSIMPSVP